MDLAARAAVVQPPLDGDLLAFVLADVFDVDVHSRFSAVVRRQRRSASASSRLHPLRAPSAPSRSVSFADPCAAISSISVPVVADLLHRRQRRRPVDRAVERHEVIVGPPAVVVHVRRDQVLRHRFDGVDQVAVHVRVAEVEADADAGARRARPRRSARATRRATARSESLRRATRTPSGSASRCSSSMLRRARVAAVVGRRRLLRAAAGPDVRHQHAERECAARCAARARLRPSARARASRRRSPASAAGPSARPRSSRRSARERCAARGPPRPATAAGRRPPPGCGSRSASASRTARRARTRARAISSRCSRRQPLVVVEVRRDPERAFATSRTIHCSDRDLLPTLHVSAAPRRAPASSSRSRAKRGYFSRLVRA